jgi:hypothetical protein
MKWEASDEGEVDTEVRKGFERIWQKTLTTSLIDWRIAGIRDNDRKALRAATTAVAKPAGPPPAMKSSGFMNCPVPTSRVSSMVLSLTG